MVKESPMHVSLLYNDRINSIKLEETPNIDTVKLGRHKDPSPIELNLTKNFVNLNKTRTRLVEPGTQGAINYSLFTIKHHRNKTPLE